MVKLVGYKNAWKFVLFELFKLLKTKCFELLLIHPCTEIFSRRKIDMCGDASQLLLS